MPLQKHLPIDATCERCMSCGNAKIRAWRGKNQPRNSAPAAHAFRAAQHARANSARASEDADGVLPDAPRAAAAPRDDAGKSRARAGEDHAGALEPVGPVVVVCEGGMRAKQDDDEPCLW